MGKGKDLTELEIGQIIAYRGQGLSIRVIAEKVGRSKSAVDNVIKNPDQYNQTSRKGPAFKLNDRDSHQVLRLLTNDKMSCAK